MRLKKAAQRAALLAIGSLAAWHGPRPFVINSASAEEPAFARPFDLEIWMRFRLPQDPEPVVDPRLIAEVVMACVEGPTTIEACATRRQTIVASFKQAHTDGAALRTVAACLSNGCDRLVPIAPANACLFWSLYFDRFPEQVVLSDRAAKDRTCAESRFGNDQLRAGIVRLWNRSANGD